MSTASSRWSERWSRRGKLAASGSRPSRTPNPALISFVYGDPDAPSLPLSDMVAAAESLAEHNRTDALSYQEAIRGDELNESLAIKLKREQGIEVSPDQILVTDGGSGGLSLLADMLLDPGDTILADGPGWMGANHMFRLSGANIISIDLDEDGLDPAKVAGKLDELEREGTTPKFLYTIPTFQNPAGVEMSLERRQGLAKLADERGLLIIEDDAYIDLRFRGEKKPTLFQLSKTDNVLFFGTLSKTIAAGLRIGFMTGPAEILETMARGRVDSLRNAYSAALADWYLRSGTWDKHIVELRSIYGEKCDRMLAALEREMPEGTHWTRPNGGFFLWVTLPEGVDAVEILPQAREAGVDYIPGPSFYGDGVSGRQSLRLSYSAVTLEQIDTGVARLAAVVRAAAQVATPAD